MWTSVNPNPPNICTFPYLLHCKTYFENQNRILFICAFYCMSPFHFLPVPFNAFESWLSIFLDRFWVFQFLWYENFEFQFTHPLFGKQYMYACVSQPSIKTLLFIDLNKNPMKGLLELNKIFFQSPIIVNTFCSKFKNYINLLEIFSRINMNGIANFPNSKPYI